MRKLAAGTGIFTTGSSVGKRAGVGSGGAADSKHSGQSMSDASAVPVFGD